MTLLALALDTRDGPADLFTALPERLDRAADLVTIADGFADAAGDGLDALLLANWLGARTGRTGILPGAAVNVLEPFHVSTAVATLDFVTQGRAGLLVQSLRGDRAEQAIRALGPLNGFPDTDPAALARDTADAIEAIRLLWNSWDDDAVIRDPVSQRFVDGSKLHYIRFKGRHFSVLGPSITPRPPQGQPLVATDLASGDDPAAADGADLVFLAAHDADAVRALIVGLHARGRRPLVVADVLVSFGQAIAPDEPALRWTGDPAGLVDQVRAWSRQLPVAGLRFRPAVPARDLGPLLDTVLPALRGGRLDAGGTLRARFGLPPAPARHLPAASAA